MSTSAKLDRAELIRELMNMRDRIDATIDLLLPSDDDGDCEHPAEGIVEAAETFDEVSYTCSRCHEVRAVPFNHKE